MTGRRRRLLLALAAGALAPALAGCGLGAGESSGGVGLRVSDDFGAKRIETPEPPKQQGEDTVMRLLQRNVEQVETRYGGGFVQGINGLEGEASGEQLVDWFFYVNGVLAGRGSAAWKLRDGEQIWWDRHRWDLAEIGAVVGAYPEPMKSGHGGKYQGALLDCRAEATICDAAQGRLEGDGITVTRGKAADQGSAQTRVVVGPWQGIRTAAPELASLERGPDHSGVFARLERSGRVNPLRADGSGQLHGAAAAGLIAALREGDRSPLWVITGADRPTLAAAVQALSARELAGSMAVAVKPGGGAEALPLRGGSEDQ